MRLFSCLFFSYPNWLRLGLPPALFFSSFFPSHLVIIPVTNMKPRWCVSGILLIYLTIYVAALCICNRNPVLDARSPASPCGAPRHAEASPFCCFAQIESIKESFLAHNRALLALYSTNTVQPSPALRCVCVCVRTWEI